MSVDVIPLLIFEGPARVYAGPGPLTLRISGRTHASGGLRSLDVSFSGAAAVPGLSGEVHDARLEAVGAELWRLVSASSAWDIRARAVHVHEDPGAAFSRALPPRHVPLRKRVLWGLALALVRSATGRRLLRRLRS